MAGPLVSIIVPVYNGGRTLSRCLESILKSTYPSIEFIVVDDHSDDDTVDIAESFNAKIIRLDGHKGAAHARNRGAEAAAGHILFFVDADVILYPDCVEKIVTTFEEYPEVSAIFGSYDDQPGSPNFLSQYRNLFHHFIHQTSLEDASTFWTACGAIKREVFFKVGKFDEDCRMMEDIELGYRLKNRRKRILLKKDLLVTHLKHYSFFSLLQSDLFDRAVPWTLLILTRKPSVNDLNLKPRHKISAMLLILLILSIFLTPLSVWFVPAIPILFALVLFINYDVYTFFHRKRGLLFALEVIPFHLLYYLYSSLGFFLGLCKYLWERQFSRIEASTPRDGTKPL